MTAEKIIEQIKTDSEKEIREIITEAKKQANMIINDAKKEAQIETEKILATGKTQSENVKKILISKAHQDITRETMKAREDIIEECFTKAHTKLSHLRNDDYKKIVTQLIEDRCKKFDKNCTIVTSKDIDKEIAKRLNINVTGTIKASGGIIFKSADEKITLDNTFDGILKRKKDKIRIKVGKLLFS